MESSTGRLVVCRVGATLCGLDIAHVLEVLRPLPLLAVAEMPAFVMGLSILRGDPVPVVDARVLLGAEATTQAPRRLVSLRVGERRVCLAVDDVIGVRDADRSGATLPSLLGEIAGDLVARVGTLDASLLFVLRAGRILPTAES